MAWRVAHSLEVLTAEVRQLHPGTTVWTIGDEDHQHEWSDHNPNECCDVVCAADILGNAGLNLRWFADAIVATDPPGLKYTIYRDRIWFPGLGWQPYRGQFHTHVHVSVGWGPDGRSVGNFDDRSPWGLLEGDDDMTPQEMLRAGVTRVADGDEMSVETALTYSHHHAHAAAGRTATILAEQRAGFAALLAAQSGDDVAEAAAAAARTAVRAEFAALGPALAAQLADVPAERVQAALRAVLGSLDES